jgi:hypothetical protein
MIAAGFAMRLEHDEADVCDVDHGTRQASRVGSQIVTGTATW